MKNILVVYATREGTTQRVAQHLAATLHARGLRATVRDAREVDPAINLEPFDAFVLAASVHFGKHEKEAATFVKMHRDALAAKPCAFLSISGSEATAEDPRAPSAAREQARADARQAVTSFFHETGWQPSNVELVAGAMLCKQYSFFTRMLVKLVSRKKGVTIDTTQDQVFTDWLALDHFIEPFVASLGSAPSHGETQPSHSAAGSTVAAPATLVGDA